MPTIAAIIIRAIPVLQASFPLNDGGLFVAMAGQVADAGFRLPEYASYNGLEIPFAYPPGGLYVAAMLHKALGASLVDIAHFFPLVCAVLTVPIVALISFELLGRFMPAGAAAMAYALTPRAWEWLVAGGGITRSLAVLLCLLAILVAVRARGGASLRAGVAVGVLGGLAALTHPQVGLFAAVTLAMLWLLSSKLTATIRGVTALAGLMTVGPWLLLIVGRHGAAPIWSAFSTGDGVGVVLYNLISLGISGAALVDIFMVLAVTGTVIAFAQGQKLLVLWAAAAMLIDGRAAGQYAMVPIAMLMGLAVEDFVEHVRLMRPQGDWTPHATRALVAIILVLGILGSLSAPLRSGTPLASLGESDRSAMRWLAASGYESAAVVSGERWPWDETSEWFPVLTNMSSVATVQGLEWLPSSDWRLAVERHESLQQCTSLGVRCLDAWLMHWGTPDLIYVSGRPRSGVPGSGPCCLGLATALEEDPRYEEVYSASFTRVFRVVMAGGHFGQGSRRL